MADKILTEAFNKLKAIEESEGKPFWFKDRNPKDRKAAQKQLSKDADKDSDIFGLDDEDDMYNDKVEESTVTLEDEGAAVYKAIGPLVQEILLAAKQDSDNDQIHMDSYVDEYLSIAVEDLTRRVQQAYAALKKGR